MPSIRKEARLEPRVPRDTTPSPPPAPPTPRSLALQPRLARRYVRALARKPRETWLALVQRSRRKLLGHHAVEEMLTRARAALPGDPATSGLWGACAARAAWRTSADNVAHECYLAGLEARGWGFVANAERVLGNLRAAESLLLRAEALWQSHSVNDPRVLAEHHSFRSSLCCAQRRYDAALDWADAAVHHYRQAGDLEAAWRAELTGLVALEAAGDHEHGLDRARQLLATIEEESGGAPEEFAVYLFTTHAVVDFLTHLGRFDEAAEAFAANQPRLAALGDPALTLRLDWTAARIAAGRGDEAAAEAGFRIALDQAMALGNGFTSALIALDLAMQHLERRRFREAAELAVHMTGAFQRLGLTREALAAWHLFTTAATRHEADVALAHHLARYLHQAQQDPELAWARRG